MSPDNSRIPKLSDSSKNFIPKRKSESRNDPFVERTKKTRSKKGKKVSDGMVETRNQKVSEDKRTILEEGIHRNPAQDENQAGRGAEGDRIRRKMCDSTFVEQGH